MMEVDHEDNGSDIEAQRSSPLLMNGELGNSSLIMRKSAIIFRSTYKFIEAGAKVASLSRVSSSSSSSTTTFYTPLPSFKHGDAEGGGDEIQVVEIVTASPDVNIVQSNNEIELQPHDQSTHQQCLQISEEIVKEKKLDSLHYFGFTSTILLLAIAAILSSVFGIIEEGLKNGWVDGAVLVGTIFVIVSFKFAGYLYKRHLWKKQKDNKARKNYPLFISETDSSFCAYFDKLNNYLNISALSIGVLITVVVFIRFKLGHKDDEYGYRLETKEEPTEIAQIMNALKKVLTESKGTVRVLITLLPLTLVGITEGVPFLISVAMAYWYPNFDVKMESVSTLCIENVGWLKEPKLKVTQFFLDKKDVTKIPPHVCSVLSDGIGHVSTRTSQTAYHRVKEAILYWVEKNTGMQRDTLDKQFTIVKDNDDEMNPFEGPCRVVIEKNGDNGKEYYSYFKGPTDSILSMCSSYYDMTGEVQDLDDGTKSDIAQTNSKNMNVVAFAFKHTQDVVELDENGLTFIGMFVLEDTFNLDNMRQAIANLKEGGVKMIFASEEDVEVLRTIGDETGLLNSHEALVVRGEEATKENVEKICMMGNSSPAHKRFLIEQLKKRGEVVAVVGEQTSESNVVLEAAHFGLPVVTNWPKTITYVINSIKGGRIVCENLRQFIQVEVILAISSLSINFILVIVDGDAPLTFIQLVWVNILVTFIGGPALLITQQATRQLSDELSIRPRKQPITKGMLRNILLQVFYQTGIFVFLQHRGSAILGITPKVNISIVFNGFALCQLFNIFSARDLEQRNYFKGLGQNYLFWALSGLYLVLQFGFIELEAFLFSNTARLNWKQWTESILIGVVTWLLDVIVKWGSQYIKIDTYCDCGVLHLARNWLQYWFMRINCCYCGPRSTPNPTLASLDSSRSTNGKGWITNITRRVKPTKHRANTLMD
ncbi:calcium-transporting ATPase 12, plasma membrane-type-like [Solanum stenotomum]|uniref:calcium-transporting ATPase 12, plasma membrane-type-like n=1 Tax=Solanum stenotomum TaxID=172797 RepID=UPI0020D01603|nr:calcium-transporting ATPase 12, plasma membrane-type-like [Solanum stenotomum]